MTESEGIVVEVAGSSRGNPGLAGIGVIVHFPSHRPTEAHAHFLGLSTSIAAEYEAVRFGLEQAVAGIGSARVAIVRLGNETVWRQLTGKSRPPAQLLEAYSAARALLEPNQHVSLELAERDALEVAERLADVAIDSRGRRQAIDDTQVGRLNVGLSKRGDRGSP